MAKDKIKKSWYKRWWAIVLYVFLGLIFLGALIGEEPTKETGTQTESEKEKTTTTTIKEKSSLERLRDSLEDSKQKLDVLDKVKECSKICAGENSDIPAVVDQMYMDCYEAYYQGGEEVLDEYIKACRGE